MDIDWEPLRRLVEEHQSFAITSHVRPDADALGSELALAGLLEAAGKTVRIVNPSASPETLDFLDPGRKVRKLGDGVTAEEVLAVDVHLVVDTSAWGQLGEVAALLRRTPAKKAVIDHHVSSDDLGAEMFKDVEAEATGALIHRFARHMGWPIGPQGATELYCAIATDTGWFRFPSTTAATMRTIAELIDAGARPDLIYRQLYEQSTLARLRLAGRVLNRVTLECDGRLAFTSVLWDDFVETGARPVDTEDLVNECLKIAGTEAAFIAVEQITRQVKVSFRSRSELNVAEIAERFGGGGHRKASGAMLPGPPTRVLTEVLAVMKAALAPAVPVETS